MEILLLNSPLQLLILILSYIKIFKHFNFNKESTIAIIAPNSINWVAIFIASILYRCHVVIISHRKSIIEIKNEILRSSANIIFTTDDIYDNLMVDSKGKDIRMFYNINRIFNTGNIENDSIYKIKIDLLYSMYEEEYSTYYEINTKLMLDNNQISNLEKGKLIDEIFKISKYNKNVSSYISEVPFSQKLITFSDNSFLKKSLYSTDIETFISDLKKAHYYMFNKNFLNTTLYNIHYDDYPVMALVQLLEGHYDRSILKQKTFFTKESFDKFWKEYIISELENKWTYILCNNFKFFYSRLVTKVFKRHFPYTKEFIILDGIIPYKWLQLLSKSKLTFSISITNYYTKNFISYYKNINNKNNLSHLGNLIKNPSVNLNFSGDITRNFNRKGFSINLDVLERIINGIPIVNNTLVYSNKNKLRIIVEINDKLINALEIIAPKDIYSYLMKQIKKVIKLDKDELFVYDKITFNSWISKTHNGNIKHFLFK